MRKILMLGLVLGLIASVGNQTRADVLWDNGPLSTGAALSGGGAAPAGTTWSEIQTGNTLFGFGHQLPTGNRVADDFTLSVGSAIDMITFYGYQTGSTTTSTFNNLSLRIWDSGGPGTGNIVFGDTVTNYLTSSVFSNIYRTSSTAATTRPIMQLTVDLSALNLDLAAGTYWLDWAAGGTLASGPWAPPVTIVGLLGKPGANGRQFTTALGSFGPALDGTTPQDLPFIINGTPVPEPTSFGVCAIALLGMVARRRRS